jgi:hypothetical protein
MYACMYVCMYIRIHIHDEMVDVQVTVGSWVRSADTLTKQATWARVLLTHTHTDTAATRTPLTSTKVLAY